MMNIMEINGYRAVVQYDPEIDMFRGEFIGLNGGADFTLKILITCARKVKFLYRFFWTCAARMAWSRERSFRANLIFEFPPPVTRRDRGLTSSKSPC